LYFKNGSLLDQEVSTSKTALTTPIHTVKTAIPNQILMNNRLNTRVVAHSKKKKKKKRDKGHLQRSIDTKFTDREANSSRKKSKNHLHRNQSNARPHGGIATNNLEIHWEIINDGEEGNTHKPIGDQNSSNGSVSKQSHGHQGLLGKL
jgi:hypothetical protein